MIKEMVFQSAKRLKVLNYLDAALYLLKVFKNRQVNLAIKNVPNDFQWPPSKFIFNTHGHVHLPYYHTSGLEDAGLIAEMLYLHLPDHNLKILDWGCGLGRVLSHLKDFLNDRSIELYGTDSDRETIDWCKQNLKDAQFSLNELMPPLPFPDKNFDVIYGFSVLPHFSERNIKIWLEELKRVLKKGGLALLSTQGKYYFRFLSEKEKKRFNNGELVIKDRAKEGSRRFLSYQPPIYMKKILKDWEILSHLDDSYDKYSPHDLWVLKKP